MHTLCVKKIAGKSCSNAFKRLPTNGTFKLQKQKFNKKEIRIKMKVNKQISPILLSLLYLHFAKKSKHK